MPFYASFPFDRPVPGRAQQATQLLIALCLGVAGFSAHATVSSFQAGMLSSGTAPFDATAGAGLDASASDAIIRTHDVASYNVQYTLNPQDEGTRLTLTIGATTVPLNYTGPANPKIAYFSVADLPTGGAGCQNIHHKNQAGASPAFL